VAGSQLGALAITADGDTGGTIGDLNGFTVTFSNYGTRLFVNIY
jgi:hypothetical protein